MEDIGRFVVVMIVLITWVVGAASIIHFLINHVRIV